MKIKKRMKCKITGRVQMVMFRDFVRRKARTLGLLGSVQNLSDGSVFVLTEGEEEKLQLFLSLLHKGPLLSRIDKVESSFSEATNEFSKFDIIY
jgi:acylphosphatase